jgi:hypothetical protein
MSDEKKKCMWTAVMSVVVLAVLLGAYGGIYLATVEISMQLCDDGQYTGKTVPSYPRVMRLTMSDSAYALWEAIFEPAHCLDRRIPPDVWAFGPLMSRIRQLEIEGLEWHRKHGL